MNNEKRNSYKISVGKTQSKENLGRPTIMSKDIIQMDHTEIWWVDWTGLIWLRIRATGSPSKYGVEHSCFLNAGKIFAKCAVTFTRNILLFAVD